MFTATQEARQKLIEYLETNTIDSAVRVFASPGGCSGVSLAMALDEKRPGDKEFTHDGLTFLIEKQLLVKSGGIKIDYVEQGMKSGFIVTSEKPLNDCAPACGGSCCC